MSSSVHVMVIVVETGDSISQDSTACEGCAVRLHAVEYVGSKQKEAGALEPHRGRRGLHARGWCLVGAA